MPADDAPAVRCNVTLAMVVSRGASNVHLA
jgi:hypothetical protein